VGGGAGRVHPHCRKVEHSQLEGSIRAGPAADSKLVRGLKRASAKLKAIGKGCPIGRDPQLKAPPCFG